MRQQKTVTVAVVSTMALVVAGCGVSGYNSNCSGNVCTYAFNGAQTLQLDFIRRGSKIELKNFGDGQIKVAAHGREAPVSVGKRVTFAGFVLDLERLDGHKGTLLIRSAG
ncbi:MAG: hypothetical protein QOK16_3014 [Solirubrobacteraceae bacterium]|nr:hypothetical protein [Solirubrobacteraceae bacterium]